MADVAVMSSSSNRTRPVLVSGGALSSRSL
jgi:hypothetical protein